jgi:hypothetical protein
MDDINKIINELKGLCPESIHCLQNISNVIRIGKNGNEHYLAASKIGEEELPKLLLKKKFGEVISLTKLWRKMNGEKQ